MILEQLADYARIRAKQAKFVMPEARLRAHAESLPRGNFRFEKALAGKEMAFICEVKKASPSKGIIDPTFDYLSIALQYEEAGADCLSVLTEPKWFLGSDDIFRAIRTVTDLPMIRKDFTVDPYQIYEAKVMGADAVLLICALLDTDTLREYLTLCDGLGLSALVEAHDESELASAVEAGARLIGVNNRNLKDFTVDLQNAARLREKAPENVIFIAESGIASPQDAKKLRQAGADAALVGEYLMRASDKELALAGLREATK